VSLWIVENECASHTRIDVAGTVLRNVTNWLHGSDNGFAFGWQPVDVVPDKLLHVAFAFDEEVPAHSRELVGAIARHIQGELFDVFFADELGFDTVQVSFLRRFGR
jgi:hypothetical protein